MLRHKDGDDSCTLSSSLCTKASTASAEAVAVRAAAEQTRADPRVRALPGQFEARLAA